MDELSKAASAMGKKGGKARAENLTAKKRKAIASSGGEALAKKSPEELSEIRRKAWRTRRANLKK